MIEREKERERERERERECERKTKSKQHFPHRTASIERPASSVQHPVSTSPRKMVSRLFSLHAGDATLCHSIPPSPHAVQSDEDEESEMEHLSTPVKQKKHALEPHSSTKEKYSCRVRHSRSSTATSSKPHTSRSDSIPRVAKQRAKRGSALTFNGKRPPKCPARLAAHMKAYERHQQEMQKRRAERKATSARKPKKALTPYQEEYRQHFVLNMKSREGVSRHRLVQAAKAWRERHEALRAAAE